MVASSRYFKVKRKMCIIENLPCHFRPFSAPVYEIASIARALNFTNDNGFHDRE